MGESTGDPVVDQALDELASADAELAEMARSGFGSLTWGQGLAAVTAHGLADFLWYQQPTKWMCGLDEKLEIAAALADLFERVDKPWYATMCASPQTATILTTYERDGDAAGLKAYRAALVATGTEPPDLPGLFLWGSVMGSEEAPAYWSLSVGWSAPSRPGRH
ncbi:MAG: hypothetical protein QOE61_3103 [Micromonosporaceae bacterium]|nr:hypothetical protein [Micromonosporaceae bacterium]